MNVTKAGGQPVQYRYDTEEVTQKRKAEQPKPEKEKQAKAQLYASESQKTNEEKSGSTLKTGAINITV